MECQKAREDTRFQEKEKGTKNTAQGAAGV